ncbi:superinfection immunity protein [bacterium]|nr:MAG: superinfection immunity protein [bacterium]
MRTEAHGTVLVAWVLTVFTGLYLLPWAIAATRGKSDRWSIFWVTFLFGWTGIGWLIALILSCLPHRLVRLAPVPTPAGWYPQSDGTHAFWDGMRWTGHRA